MRIRGIAAGLALLAATSVAQTFVPVTRTSKESQVECGSYYTKAQEEAFLHKRHLARQATLRAAGVQSLRAARANVDVGNIAVIGGGNGVVGTRNPFDLNARTVIFTPENSAYSLSGTASDTFDTIASQNGTRLNLEDDDFESVPLPFPFPYFGTSYTSAFVNSNGTLTFGKGDLDYSGAFGHFSAGPPVIAGLFSDLNPIASSDGVRVRTEAGRVVVSWTNVPLIGESFSSSGQAFQIRLYPTGKIELTYSRVSAAFDHGVVGIAPGGAKQVELVDLSNTSGSYSTGVGESFTSSSAAEIDIMAAAQRFYQTHDDSYDYLVFYNAMNVSAGTGVVAYELTTRSSGKGYGDIALDEGALYGSPKRLQAVLNMGPTSQYPVNPNGVVSSRGLIGDTPLTILAHEAGHLFLALVSVPSPTNSFFPPMLGAGLAHWAFPFNSDASFMEGNRIEDQGAGASPRFRTTATVQRYSELDQYLMGLRRPEEVAPTFAVLSSNMANSRAPQSGVTFGGTRLDITVNDVAAAAGRRTPDATVAQRHFRMAFVMIVDENADLGPGTPAAAAIAQVEAYRTAFEPFFAAGTDYRGSVSTTLQRSVDWSFSGKGLTSGGAALTGLRLSQPANKDLNFTLEDPNGVIVSTLGRIVITEGSTDAPILIRADRLGVGEVRIIPDDPNYETVVARIPVRPQSELRVQVASGDKQPAVAGQLPKPIVVHAVDENGIAYAGQPISAVVSGGGQVTPLAALTDHNGDATFTWNTTAGSFNQLTFTIQGVLGSTAIATALGPPAVFSGGVVSSASFQPGIASSSFVSIFGGSLAGGSLAQSLTADFPTTLGGVTVTLNGEPARLSYVSDSLINFVAPANLSPGTAQLRISTALGTSELVPVTIAERAPGIFFNAATGEGAILINALWVLTSQQPAQPNQFIAVFATGLGANPQAVTTTAIAGTPLTVTYAGPTVIPGLDQINIQIPSGLPSGSQKLVLKVGGVVSNAVDVFIQ